MTLPQRLGFVVLAAVLSAGLSFVHLDARLEDGLLRTFRGSAPRSTAITIVAIDDLTLEQVAANESYRLNFGDWPYDRSLWARVVAHLQTLGARAVVLDGTLEGRRDDGAGDQNLADVLTAPGALPFFAGLSATATAPVTEAPRSAPRSALARHARRSAAQAPRPSRRLRSRHPATPASSPAAIAAAPERGHPLGLAERGSRRRRPVAPHALHRLG
jgi:adenylate cyclase